MLKLSQCAIARIHKPTPSRYVVHHLQPQVCGGLSVPENMVTLDDACHYTVHRILYGLRLQGEHSTDPRTAWAKLGNRKQRALAADGYARCVAAGTTGKIPNEG